LLFLSAHAMTQQECMENYPAGSAALGRCTKMVNKMAKAAEKTDFHARVQLQKTAKKSLKDLASQMQKTGDANIVAAKEVKAMATGVWAENRKQALLQFAYKRLGLRTDSHVCRQNGADVQIDFPTNFDDQRETDLSFAIQEDTLTGKFWLFMKVNGATELQSLDVSLYDAYADDWDAQQVQLAEQTKLNADNKHSQAENQFWNVQVEDKYHGGSLIAAKVIKVFSSNIMALGAGIEWVYCTERTPIGIIEPTTEPITTSDLAPELTTPEPTTEPTPTTDFPVVETEADNDSEPVCYYESDCVKAYFNHGDVRGWAVYEFGDGWTHLPDGTTEEDICLSRLQTDDYDGLNSQALISYDEVLTQTHIPGCDYNYINEWDCFPDFSIMEEQTNVGSNWFFGDVYRSITIKDACATLVTSSKVAEITTIREVGPDGALTIFYDKANYMAVVSTSGVDNSLMYPGKTVDFYENADCTGNTESRYSENEDFTITQLGLLVGSVKAVGIECIDISVIPSQENLNVVSDAMYWNDGDSWAWIRMSQPTPFHPTRIQIDYKGASNIGQFHVHEYQSVSDHFDDCADAGGHYNPVNSNLEPEFEVGDLSGKHGTFADWGVTDDAGSKVFYDFNLPLWGKNSVAARSIVLHDAVSGERVACGNLGHMGPAWDQQPELDEVKIDYNGEDVYGDQVFQQRKDCPWCATSVKSHLRYKDDAEAESNFHVHTIRDEVNEWTGCNNNGGHYNPQVGVPCMDLSQASNSDPYTYPICELGDLSTKLGKLVIKSAEWTTSQSTDLFAPLTESSQGYNFSNRSITIHAPNGDRMTCGPTDLN